MKIVFSVLTVVLLSVVATAVYADGTHGVKVTVINNSGGDIEIMTYNSKDGSRTVPHKVYYAHPGGVRTVKAHGQGTDKLRISVHRSGKGNTKCIAPKGGAFVELKADKKWSDGDTVTVTKCEGPK